MREKLDHEELEKLSVFRLCFGLTFPEGFPLSYNSPNITPD